MVELWVMPAVMAEVVERLGPALHPQEDRVEIIPVRGRCAAGRRRIRCVRREEPAWRVWCGASVFSGLRSIEDQCRFERAVAERKTCGAPPVCPVAKPRTVAVVSGAAERS
ncbi:MAG: hypothetical protein R3F60_27470 [bacterium]